MEARERVVPELTREVVLNAVGLLEKAKFEAQQKMYELVRRQQLPPHVINTVIKSEELRAQDLFFNMTQIEECDIEPNIERLELIEDQSFKDIIADYAQQS